MREHFDSQLEKLNRELIRLGTLCEQAIAFSMKALFENDSEMAEQTFTAESAIDEQEREIESICLKLLLHQQPVARDLRLISAASKMISDMERIGDQASDIAEIAKLIGGNILCSEIHLKEMAEKTVRMVTKSIDSFVRNDLNLALELSKDDDEVDSLFIVIRNEIASLIHNNPDNSETGLDLMMIAKYLERIGDHAVNISEWVAYSITGTHKNIEVN